MASNRTRRTSKKDWAPDFLEAFERLGMVVAACDLIGIGRRTAYDRREKDEEFRQAWDDVAERSTERMEAEAFRRAVEGWTERQLFDDEGNAIGEVRKFSDTLLIFMLKSRRPATYREHRQVQHVGPDGGPLGLRVELDEKDREALSDVLRRRPASRGE